MKTICFVSMLSIILLVILGFEYSHCIKGFFTENYDHPIIDNGQLTISYLSYSALIF